MKRASLALAAAAAIVVSATACDGLKEAMTAHTNTAAQAGSQELSVERLSKLIDESGAPPRKDIASAIANAWVDYQLLGKAAATGDTVVPQAQMDSSLWAAVASVKARKYYDIVSKSWAPAGDTAAARKAYENGDILAASHILLVTRGAPDNVKQAAKAKAEALRKQATAANFAQLAQQNSMDRASAARGGSLGVFRKGAMVPQFEQALLALKPGEISPVIETEYGYHIIRRPTFAEVEGQIMQASQGAAMQSAESTFVAKMQENGKINMRSDAAPTARLVIADPDAHRKDDAALASSVAGTFTAGDLARWINTFPAVAMARQRAQLANAPDSVVMMFVKNFVTNQLVLRAADSAHVGPTPQEMQQLRQNFVAARDAAWTALGIDPKSLADSAKTPDAREKLASSRVDSYMDRLVTGQAQFVQVVEPVATVLRQKFNASVNSAGLDRAVEMSKKAYVAADSARRAAPPQSAVPQPGPQSAVPLPGGANQGQPSGAPPAQPAPSARP
jgi:hypothetical protein